MYLSYIKNARCQGGSKSNSPVDLRYVRNKDVYMFIKPEQFSAKKQ